MLSKQISVFIENREGRLSEVLNVLKREKVNILSLSLADTSDYGILRIIVDDAEKGSKALSLSGFTSMVSTVIIIETSHQAGALEKIVSKLCDNKINIEYMYGLSAHHEGAKIVAKVNNAELAERILSK